jgi:hypothetical protein
MKTRQANRSLLRKAAKRRHYDSAFKRHLVVKTSHPCLFALVLLLLDSLRFQRLHRVICPVIMVQRNQTLALSHDVWIQIVALTIVLPAVHNIFERYFHIPPPNTTLLDGWHVTDTPTFQSQRIFAKPGPDAGNDLSERVSTPT